MFINHTHISRERRSAVNLVRALSLGIVGLSAVCLASMQPFSTTSAQAAEPAITVSWADDSSAAAQFQPVRDTASPHYADLKNVVVKVNQTTDLTDQIVQVDVSGMPGGSQAADSQNDTKDTAYNFVQAMQCWGPDPLASDFYETCQWGGWTTGSYPGRPGTELADPQSDGRGTASYSVPFRTVQGNKVEAIPYGTQNPLATYLTASVTNEVVAARLQGDGSTTFPFETQTADNAPQLGCGDTSSVAGTRCWLVIVPRGSVMSQQGIQGNSGTCAKHNGFTSTPGAEGKLQIGSPVNPTCDYWANRMVVPLDFTPLGNTCPPGNAERRTIGSVLINDAMSSWQPAACDALGATYNLSNNPDSIARSQLLAGQAGLAFVGAPLTPDSLATDAERSTLSESTIVYAPVAVSAPTIGFYASNEIVGRISDLRLSPRIIAKLLTQSYGYNVPSNSCGICQGG